MRPRYFLDANVLFTAAISPHGASRTILKLADAGVCVALSSAFALDEAQRNIRAKRPSKLGAMKTVEGLVELAPEAKPSLVEWAAQYLPDKDAPILAAAIASKANFLVTGDRRHFGTHYGNAIQRVTILTPRNAL